MKWLATTLLFASHGCAGAGARVVAEPRALASASSAPGIARVTDLGDLGVIPSSGSLPTQGSDGAFTVGEAVLIEGDDFGKLPAVSVGDQPTEVLARTGNGGIVCRIPPGVPTGPAQIEVSNRRGRHRTGIEILRRALVVQPEAGRVYVVEIGADGSPGKPVSIALEGATSVVISGDGRAAYVALGDPSPPGFAVLSMTAPGGVKAHRNVTASGEGPVLMATAADQSLLAVIAGATLTLFDISSPLVPSSLGEPLALPARPRAAVLSRDGTALIVLSAADNALISVDLSSPRRPKVGEPVRLFAQERVPLARDLAFSPANDELWVLSGDSEASIVAGRRPTRITVVERKEARLTVARHVELGGAGAPRSLAVAQRESVIGGAAIRSTRRRAAIAVASMSRELLESADSATLDKGLLGRADLDGQLEVLDHGISVHADAALSHDGRWIASAARRAGERPSFGLAMTPLAGGEARWLELGDASHGSLKNAAGVALTP